MTVVPKGVAIVTGGSSGLGQAMAMILAKRGFAVGLTARRADRLRDVVRDIEALGGLAASVAADAEDLAATQDAIRRLSETLGPVDLLIANAGIAPRQPAERLSVETLERIVRVNLLGAAAAVEAVLPAMIERKKGRIAGVSSLAGYRACKKGHAAYCASKAALSTWLEGLRLELRGTGVGVTVIHPGYVHTPMTAAAASRGSLPFVLEVEPAAQRIVQGLLNGKNRVDFPTPAHLGMSLLRVLPIPLYDQLMAWVDRDDE